MKQLEGKLQSECVRWFQYQYPEYRKLLFHPANGTKRTIKTAIALKKQGVVAGVSDLIFLLPNKKFPFLCLEMKIGNNTQTMYQREFATDVERVGGCYEVIRSFDAFKESINEYMKNR
jgi:hypothetical protein